MGLPVLKGARVTLRPMIAADASAMVAALNTWDVAKWLTAPPYPYAMSDALWFIENGQHDAWAITLADQFIGSVGDLPELGYWLAPDHHGQGVMSEAAGLAVEWHFKVSDAPLLSGHFAGNAASRRVLQKLGFVDTHTTEQFSAPLNKAVTHQCMTLTYDRWHALRNAAG